MPLTYATAKVGEFTFENKQPPVKFLKFKAMNNNAGWEAVTNKETTIAAGDAFAYGVESHDGALLTDQILELPRNSATGGKLVDTSLTKEYDNGNDEIDGTTGAFAVAGNPFMSTISYDDLQDENSGVINASGYYVWDGTASSNGAFVLQEVSESDEDLIAPLQGFVVFGNATGDNKFSLTFDPATLAGSGGGVLKSSSSPAKLTVSASNGTASTRAVILNKENGGTTFNSNVDLPKLMSGASDVPEIYTLKQTAAGKSVALGINVVNTDNIVIPLGISTSTDNIKLTFSGMDTYNAVVTLYDRSQVIDLTGQETAEYTLNNYQPSGDNSLYISLSPRSTTEAAAADASAVTVYSSNGAIYALSTAANPIVSLSVYNLQGALVSSSVVNAPVYTGNVASAGIYVVKVVTTQGVQSVKLISN
jgi:hypothetical protein